MSIWSEAELARQSTASTSCGWNRCGTTDQSASLSSCGLDVAFTEPPDELADARAAALRIDPAS